MIEIPYKLKKFILLKVCDKHTSKKSWNITVKTLGITGKSFSEELILASTNPKYDKILFIELQVQYTKITSSEHIVYINCSECLNKNKNKLV